VEMSQWSLKANISVTSTSDTDALGPFPYRRTGHFFEDLVVACSTKACADVRDRVFGLLGLMEAKDIWRLKSENPFPIDYNDSIIEVFYKALQHFTPCAESHKVDMIHMADAFCKALHLDGQNKSSFVVQFGDYKKSKHFHIPVSIFVYATTFLDIVHQNYKIGHSYLDSGFSIYEIVLCPCRYCERYLSPRIAERLLKRDGLERLWLCIPVNRTSLVFIFEGQHSVRESAFLTGGQIFCTEKTAVLLIHGHFSQCYGMANVQGHSNSWTMVTMNMQLIHDTMFNYPRDYPSAESLDRSRTKLLWRGHAPEASQGYVSTYECWGRRRRREG
jgi:hypothetical protein